MEIKTKYQPGDTLFFIADNRIKSALCRWIDIRCMNTGVTPKIVITYSFEGGNPDRLEDQVGNTKEDLFSKF